MSGIVPMRVRGRSFLAFALAPEPPIVEWLSQLDVWTRNSAGFFVGRPVILDLTSVELSGAASQYFSQNTYESEDDPRRILKIFRTYLH